ncbi:glycosyltransferase [Candidatus Dojkabacteria bacterium]|nr:glycosyltransferase [Candidatus Dojkabacteria bacterium]
MLKNKTVAVVLPAYNEETQIGKVIETMPNYVDRIIVVNDYSKDKTAQVVQKYIESRYGKTEMEIPDASRQKIVDNGYNRAEIVAQEMTRQQEKDFVPFEIANKNPDKSRIILINHKENGSVGAAMATGYRWCRDHNIDCTGLMGGDGQMDPDELEEICMPVINGEVDYVKGNRLIHRSALLVIPRLRYLGNSVLSLLNKIASGYWHVSDSQTGFTAISLGALKAINLHKIYRSYGCPNDMLIKLNIAFCTLKEVPIKPIYDIGEKSKMKIFKLIPRISWLLFKGFWKRLYIKYLFRDFHPLFLLYHLSFVLLLINIPFLIQVIRSLSPKILLPQQSLLIFMFLTISGLQSLFFAMWMDIMDNDRLQK